ncbi:MAG: hypothetical protein JO031_10620 [Ktedonobacteraceae bacterium]|nr:hypothetical protein [Ktedonobacteraceae bacterium]
MRHCRTPHPHRSHEDGPWTYLNGIGPCDRILRDWEANKKLSLWVAGGQAAACPPATHSDQGEPPEVARSPGELLSMQS